MPWKTISQRNSIEIIIMQQIEERKLGIHTFLPEKGRTFFTFTLFCPKRDALLTFLLFAPKSDANEEISFEFTTGASAYCKIS